MFRPVPADADFTALEDEELARWAAHRVFERSVELRAGAEPWVFYEGPPTANGRPGLHHVWARVYKDLFCRYRTMRGYAVPRKAGWDTHGLPVEVEVEKQLGITAKRQIEDEVGIAEFTRLCRESVRNYVGEWKTLTERIGYWIDIDDAYWTFAPEYVESVWANLKSLWDQELLYEDIKVVPYCPRCGTALSSHELGQPDVYREVEDESAYVRFPLVDDGDAADRLRSVLGRDTLAGLSLVAWTTTPWTLLSNTGAAVGPDLVYAVVGGDVVAESLVEQVFGEGTTADVSVSGSALVGLHYLRPFDDLTPGPADAGRVGWRVVAGDFVEADEGTGIVHLAPAFGEVDRQVGRAADLPTLNPVGPDGRFTDAVPWLAGLAVRDVNGTVNDRLEAAGLLLRRHPYAHPYPHCWRCGTALIYWGKPSWYIRTSERKDALVEQNRTIGWHPEHIRDGRMGEWLANNVDWALSRDRFWGTPLPVWRCDEGHLRCVGLAGRAVGAQRHRRDRRRPSPSGDRRGDGAVRRVRWRRRDAARRAGDRRLVRLGVDADGPVGLPGHAGIGRVVRLPGRLHLRGHRPDPRLVLLAAGRQHAGAGGDALPERALPRPHRRRRRPQDVQERGQRHRPVGDPHHPGGGPPALVDVLAGLAVDADPGQLRGHRHRHAGLVAHAVEHLVVLHHLRGAERLRPVRPRRCPRRPTGPCSTAGCCPGCTPPSPWSPAPSTGTSRIPAATAVAELDRRHLQLVRAAQPPALLAHRSREPTRPTRSAPRPPSTTCS